MNRLAGRFMTVGLMVALAIVISFGGLISAQAMLEGGMRHCPLMATPACGMTLTEHASEWQNLLTATTRPLSPLLALVAVIFYFLPFVRPIRKRFPKQKYSEVFTDPLRLALARGRIHSKAF